jgi:hypothetical protein
MPVILASQEEEIRSITGLSQSWAKSSVRPYLKNTQHETAGGVTQVVECLLNK